MATSVCSDNLYHGSLLHSPPHHHHYDHHRMIKRVLTSNDSMLERRTKDEECAGSHERESNLDQSHKKHHHHKHHHKHHHHKHHHKTHHKNHHKDELKKHDDDQEQKKNSDNGTTKKDDKPEQTSTDQSPPENKKQNKQPMEKSKPNEQNNKHKSTANEGGNGGGLFGLTFPGQCSNPKASNEHPNGCIEFLNCNIDSGWKPPHVEMSQLKIASPEEIVKGDVFKPCGKYLEDFKAVSVESGIPATILMSIAMQESTCNAGLTGPNGEISLMQIIPENCKGNCWDVRNNIHLGAAELQEELKQSGGNFLQAMGEVSIVFKSCTNQ